MIALQIIQIRAADIISICLIWNQRVTGWRIFNNIFFVSKVSTDKGSGPGVCDAHQKCILGKLIHLSSFRGMWSLIVISVSELHPYIVLPLPDLGGCGRPGGEVRVVGHQRQPRNQHRAGPGLPRGRCVPPLLLHRWPRDSVLVSGPLAAGAEAPGPDHAHHPGRVSEWSEDGLQHGLQLPGDLGPGPGRVSADRRRDVCGDLRQGL